MRIVRIQKRDGREVPYDRRKIVGAVARAEAAVNASAPDARQGFAEEVAGLVELLLERRFPDPALAIPGVEDVQDLVERALIELGAAAVAKAYILYRDRRAQVRAALVVREDRPRAAGEPTAETREHRGEDARRARSPQVAAKEGALAWSKGRIVAALMSEADLDRGRAEEVAARAESRVFASGLKSISTALIRELVDNELADLGLDEALAKQRPIGIPRHDLRRLLAGAREGDLAVEESVAGEILERYALEDLLPPPVADLVRAGDVAFEDLSRPHLPLALALPMDLFARGGHLTRSGQAGRSGQGGRGGQDGTGGHSGGRGSGATAAGALLAEAGRHARCVSSVLVLESAETLFDALRSPGSLDSFLAGLTAIARASGRHVELALHAPRPATLENVLTSLDAFEREASPGPLPRLVLDAPALAKASPAARVAAARLLSLGLLAPSFSGEGERYAGPGLSRPIGERGALACGAAVALNLPRLARLSGAWREDALFAAAAERIEVSLAGLAALRDFQRATTDRAAPRARAVFALSPVGLREALEILGDGEVREEHAARLVAFLVEACERLGAKRGLDLFLTPCFGERAAARFARADAAQFRVRQPWLFAEPSRSEAREALHSFGFDLPGEAPLRALLGSVATSVLHPPSALRALAGRGSGSPAAESERALEAWDRLGRLRGRTRGGAHAIYALPPLLPSAASDAPGFDPEPAFDLFAASLPTSPAPGLHAET